jgi:hypothetical protein
MTTNKQKELKQMNKIQLETKKIINEWLIKENESIKRIDLDCLKPHKTPADAGVLVHYGNDGAIAFDGEILSAFRGCAEYGQCQDLAESLIDLFYSNEYEDCGFGVWKPWN